jgi:hypothetical protein
MSVAINQRPSSPLGLSRLRQPELLRHSGVRAGAWVFGSALLAGVLVSVSSTGAQPAPVFDRALALAIFAFAAAAALMWVGFSASVHVCARAVRGRGRYRALLRRSAAFPAPLMLLASVMPLLPYSRSLLAGIYVSWLALYVITARGVYELRWTKAMFGVLVPLALFAVLLLASVSLV